MSEERIAALTYIPRPGSRWARVRVGMTLSELRAMGFLPGELNYRVRRGDIVLGQVQRDGRIVAVDVPGGGVKQAKPNTQLRPCLTCREPFRSEGSGNRMCKECRNRSVSPYAL